MNNATDGTCVRRALELATQKLQITCDTPHSEARVLLAFILNKPTSWLIAWPEEHLRAEQIHDYEDLVLRRSKGEPIAYLTGTKEFWSLELKVTTDTLIPRADTEVLVELALELIKKNNCHNLLELGTGSGAIALAIASEMPEMNILATDKIKATLLVAKENKIRHKLQNVQFIISDWFNTVKEQKFDIILSNPPYIAQDDMHLYDSGLKYEPRTALVSDQKGLADIIEIISASNQYLRQNGILAIEHGYNQASAVRSVFTKHGFTKIATRRDCTGHERVSFGNYQALTDRNINVGK